MKKFITLPIFRNWRAFFFVVSLFTLAACDLSTEEIADETIKLMEQDLKDKGAVLKISNLTLVNTNDNTYTGVAEGLLDGVKVKYDVTTHYDGENIVAEWVMLEIDGANIYEFDEDLEELFDEDY